MLGLHSVSPRFVIFLFGTFFCRGGFQYLGFPSTCLYYEVVICSKKESALKSFHSGTSRWRSTKGVTSIWKQVLLLGLYLCIGEEIGLLICLISSYLLLWYGFSIRKASAIKRLCLCFTLYMPRILLRSALVDCGISCGTSALVYLFCHCSCYSFVLCWIT